MSSPPTHWPPRAGSRAAAFTLIELLVSMAVLSLLVLAVSQIVRGTTAIATGNREHLDADGQARLVFDRTGLDFARMLKRQDVDYLFLPLAGNDKFFFYSEAVAFFDSGNATLIQSAESPLALVGYRMDASVPASPTLLRLGKGLTWEGTSATPSAAASPAPGSIVFLSPSSAPSVNPTPTPDPASTLAGHWPTTIGTPGSNYDDGADTAYHVIADGVCRMETCFLLKPLAATATTAGMPAAYSLTPYRGGVPMHKAVNGLQDVRAIVVALALLDRSSRQAAPDLHKLSSALRDIAANDLSASPPVLMAKIWQDEIDQGKLATDASIPSAAAAQVRIYQRHFYLDTN